MLGETYRGLGRSTVKNCHLRSLFHAENCRGQGQRQAQGVSPLPWSYLELSKPEGPPTWVRTLSPGSVTLGESPLTLLRTRRRKEREGQTGIPGSSLHTRPPLVSAPGLRANFPLWSFREMVFPRAEGRKEETFHFLEGISQ